MNPEIKTKTKRKTDYLVSCRFDCQTSLRSLQHICICMSRRCWHRIVSRHQAFRCIH